MEIWRPKLAQPFNTCNPMGLHTTGGYRACTGHLVGAAEAVFFRSLFEDRTSRRFKKYYSIFID